MVKRILENSKSVDGSKITVLLRGDYMEVYDQKNTFNCRFHKSIKDDVVSFFKTKATDYRDECFTGKREFGNYLYEGNWVRTNRLNDICDVIEMKFEIPNFKRGQLKRMSTNNLMDIYHQFKNLVSDN